MEPDGDPEARIRDLERPLAERASASELGTRPYEATPAPAVPVPPYPSGTPQNGSAEYGSPQYTSPYYAAPQRVVRKRSNTVMLWVLSLVVIASLGVGIAGVVLNADLGIPDSFTENSTPPIAGGGGSLDGRSPLPTGIDSTDEVVTVEAGGSISVGGIEQNQTVICDQGAVSVSGVHNTIEIRGSCTSVTVSGIENAVTVDAADAIIASGFDNRVTYRSGAPEISRSGSDNTVEQG